MRLIYTLNYKGFCKYANSQFNFVIESKELVLVCVKKLILFFDIAMYPNKTRCIKTGTFDSGIVERLKQNIPVSDTFITYHFY